MSATFLDTHAVVWLYAGELKRFPAVSKRRLSKGELLISPAVLLEIQLLFEIGRLKVQGSEMIDDLEKRISLRVCAQAFLAVASQALENSWTRDPFDRLIVAQSQLKRATLITKDTTIHSHFRLAMWD